MGKIITLTGSSGAGKTTIAAHLLTALPTLKLIVSLTTRAARPSDLPGEYQCNLTSKEFSDRAVRNEFLWNVRAHENYYGTLRSSVDDALKASHPSLMLLVPHVLVLLHRYAPNQVTSFYISAPPEEELRRRLKKRGDKADDIEKRIAECVPWDIEAATSKIPYLFVRNNGAIEKPVQAILNYLKSC